MKVIGIIGSRRKNSPKNFDDVQEAFEKLYEDGDWICSGGAREGGDQFAYRLHQEFVTPYLEFPAKWKKYGHSAGFLRNTKIAKASDVLIACVSSDRKGGTEDTIRKFIEFHGKERLYIV